MTDTPSPSAQELANELRKFHAEIVASDGGESPQMRMTREAAEHIESLLRRLSDTERELERRREQQRDAFDREQSLRAERDRLREMLAQADGVIARYLGCLGSLHHSPGYLPGDNELLANSLSRHHLSQKG